MTNLGEELKFSPECSAKYFTLPVCAIDCDFLLNTAKNSISLIQEHGQKLVQTWTLTHPHTFTSPVSFCAGDRIVSCVLNNKILMSWPISAEDLSCASKIKLKDAAFAVIAVDSLSTVIVFKNGSASPFEKALSKTDEAKEKSEFLEDKEEILWANALMHSNNIVVVYVTHKQREQYFLRTLMLKEGEDKASMLQRVELTRDELCLKCWCLDDTNFPSLLTLWSDGQVVSYSLLDQRTEDLFSIANLDDDNSISMDIAGKSHLCIVKRTADETKSSALEIWDLKYCVRKMLKPLKSKLSRSFQLKAIESSVFVTTRDGVIRIPIELEPSMLAAVVGKVKNPSSEERDTFVWTFSGELVTDLTSENSNLRISNLSCEKFQETIAKLSDEEKINFCKKLYKLKDISEEELVKMLQVSLLLKNGVSDSDEARKEHMQEEDDRLNGVFKIPFTDIFLRQHLKKLSFKEAVLTLSYLIRIFNEELFENENKTRPSDLQVVNWMQLLIQSHFDEMVMSSDDRVLKLLRVLQQTLLNKMDVYTELQEIGNLLKMIRKKKDILPKRPVNTKYCIEVLFL